MSYEVLILPKAQKELSKLPIKIYNRVKESINNFSDNPRPRNYIKLTSRNAWRIRIGD